MKWIVCQIGAREHYAVARALHRRGELAALVTDLWVPPGSLLRRATDAESIAGRYATELADAAISAPNGRMLLFALQARIGRWPLWKKILAENALFQKEAAKIIFGGALGAERHVLFSYSYAARDLFREAKRRGWVTVLGQIDPGPGEQKLVDGLRARHPGWTKSAGAVPPPHYWTEWREECELADRIVVNSEWSKSLLVDEGIAVEKIAVVPLAYEPAGGRRGEWQVTSGEWREPRLGEMALRQKSSERGDTDVEKVERVKVGSGEHGARSMERGVGSGESKGRSGEWRVTSGGRRNADVEKVEGGNRAERDRLERSDSREAESPGGEINVEKWEDGGAAEGCGDSVDQFFSKPVSEGVEVRDQRPVGRSFGASGNRCFGNTEEQRSADGAAGEKLYPERFTMERRMRVLFLGQANVRKGIQDLVEAARLLGEGPWMFDVVGRHEAIPAGIPASVVFHGQVPRSEARGWYERADVFLLPTHSDGFALTQIEAMAHGLPLVATRCCGEVVRDGVNGVLIPAGDPGALAEVIRALSQHPERLAQMSKAARETVGHFGIDRVGQALLGVAKGAPTG